MELSEVVRRRRMVRSYDPDRSVPREQLENLLNLAIRAPSAGHTQGWQFLVLDDITSRRAFWSATSDGPADSWRQRMQSAPTLVVCLADPQAYLDRYAEPDKGWTDRSTANWPVPYWQIDTGMAAMILLLAVQDAGLAACFFGVPRERWAAVQAAFAIPERLEVVGVVSIGHPAPDVRSPSLTRGRRPLASVVSYGRFDSTAPGPDPEPDSGISPPPGTVTAPVDDAAGD